MEIQDGAPGECKHYWVIPQSYEDYVTGKCKNCNVTKEFDNRYYRFESSTLMPKVWNAVTRIGSESAGRLGRNAMKVA